MNNTMRLSVFGREINVNTISPPYSDVFSDDEIVKAAEEYVCSHKEYKKMKGAYK